MKRIVLEADEGIIFEILEGEETSKEVIIKARNMVSNGVLWELPTVSAGEYAEVLSLYTDNDGNRAVVPPGWTVSGASKENIIWGKNKGLVIYRIPKENVSSIDWENRDELEALMRAYDQFVWVPVGKLASNVTINGVHYSGKFIRRSYNDTPLWVWDYNEVLNEELIVRVKRYEGFYISRYNISESSEGKLQSVKGAMPQTSYNFYVTKKMASTIEDNEAVKSHLPFGAEYDSVLEWFIESKAKTLDEIAKDSTEWGNYENTKNSPRKIVETGSREEFCVNNVYDYAGNVSELTQELHKNVCPVNRGGRYDLKGNMFSVAYRTYNAPDCITHGTGFRVVLYIK